MFFKRDYFPPDGLRYEWVGNIEHDDKIYRVNRALTRMDFGWRKKNMQTIVFKLTAMSGREEIKKFVLIPKGKLRKFGTVCDCLYAIIYNEFLTEQERNEYYHDGYF